MDNYGVHTASKPSRRRRSNLNRRPPTPHESDSPKQENRDSISLSSTPSDHVSDAPTEGNIVQEATIWSKGLNSNQFISTASCTNLSEAETMHESNDDKESSQVNAAGTSWKSLKTDRNKTSEIVIGSHHSGKPGSVSDGPGTKLNKLKLKVGGVTHTIHRRSSSDGSSIAAPDTACPPRMLSFQDNPNLRLTGKKGGLSGVPWRDFSKTGFSLRKVDSFGVDIPEESVKQAVKHIGRSSKSKSVMKKYSSDDVYGEEDDDDDDDEIRYLQKLRTSKIASDDNIDYDDESRGKKLRKLSRVLNRNSDEYASVIGDYDSSRSGKESKKSKSVRAFEDTEYMEEEGSASEGEIKHENKKQTKEVTDFSEYSKGSSITTRRRANLTGRDISPGLVANSVQFPDGLPPAPPRKPKEQLTEEEQQLKRVEAAQRRKIQNEKAARESEAEAIRKILGQDSSRKKREEKIKKRQEELAQERSANAATVASNVVRWVMGPSGTIVTFPHDIGLPSIFESNPCSYPPPREKCVGPACTNAYKYRDSKSKMPLCSLRCYKAVHDKVQPLHAC
ncbi:hypothetical protein ABFS82_02G091800 [Erythranthe guttata]|uniref:uncharacterized protein LOC105960740 isoform X2 n=1 Tax=Erythranthe guttata TaxID=4155 RepID=UPI00064D8C7C|nr:PREDICTED: uncharacterized protein LOC105960740 isoform X2 [Erythranthe guttata]|eukprot:XP_012840403.1 PREDICTED: uncharacterized protein LOC105960740 isoform X2 [Erythranthe guttata]